MSVVTLTNKKFLIMKKIFFFIAAFATSTLMGFAPPPETRTITDSDAGTSYTVSKTDFDRATANGWDEETMRLAGSNDTWIVICPGDGVQCNILFFNVGWKTKGLPSIYIF